MTPLELKAIFDDPKRSPCSKGTLIGQAARRGELSWLGDSAPQVELAYRYLTGAQRPSCPTCGELLKFKGFTRGYQQFCSKGCRGKAFQASEVGKMAREVGRETIKLRYGVANPLQLPSSLEKQRQAMKAKRKPKPPRVLKRELWIQARLARLEKDDKLRLLEPYTHSKKAYHGECLTCQLEHRIILCDGQTSRCPRCFPEPANRSRLERELAGWVRSLGLVVETNIKRKELIYPLSFDLYLPEKRLAIEVNGDYWHSDLVIDKSYHLRKLEACEAKSISLIQIFEHELVRKREKVLRRLMSLLGKVEGRIGARELELRELSAREERGFFDEHHLQGYVSSSLALGLVRGDEIYCAVSVGKPRFSRSASLELLRLASRSGWSIPGGASRLLAEVGRRYAGETLLSYFDRRWGASQTYERLGFSKTHVTAPSYVYVRRGVVISRYAAQKHKLSKLLGDKFDPTLTEHENMKRSGWLRLWDCGQTVFRRAL